MYTFKQFLHNANGVKFQQTTRISDDLFLTTSNDILESIARKKINAKYKIIVGYCGWAHGQLESEIKQKQEELQKLLNEDN